MQQIQTIIDRIRTALADDRIENTPEMKTLATDIREVSRTLNDRLRRCGEYLRQGLRAEAIQEAETEPRLLDLVGVVQGLSDDERLAWIEMMQFLELPTPEPVLFDVAEMIDEAYSEHAPLEKLLRTHRKLALQRAPLSQRLALLRRIAVEDPNSEFWETDIRAYEEARLAQIIQESRAGRKPLSVEAAQNLLAEVQGNSWLIPIPGKLVPNIQAQLQEAVRADARERLQKISADLHAAFGAMNLEQARRPYRDWNTFRPQSGLTDRDALVLETLPAIAWVEQQLEREAADAAWADHLHEIELALRRTPPDEAQLRQLSEKTTRYRRPLPGHVDSQLSGRLSAFERQRQRKRFLIVGGSTLSLIVIVAVVSFVIMRAQDASHRKEVISKIEEHLEAGELKSAEELRDKYQASWGDIPAWNETSQKVDDLASSLADRTQQAELLLDKAAALGETEETEFKKVAAEALALATATPPLPDLKRTVDLRLQKIEIERSRGLKMREEDLSSRLPAQGRQIEELKKTFATLSSADFDEQRSRIRDGLTAISSDLPGMAGRFADQHKFMLSEVDDIERKFSRSQRRAELLQELKAKSRIRGAAGVAEAKAYSDVLTTFTTTLAEDSLAAGMKRAAAESEAWQSLFALRDFPSETARLFPDSLELVNSRQAAVDKFLQTYSRSPVRSAVEKYRDALAIFEKRYKAKTGLVAQIVSDILEAEHMRDLYVIRDQTLSWPYYVLSREALDEDPIVKFSRWSVLDDPEEVKVLLKNVVNLTPAAAPQAALVKKIRSQLDNLRGETWDATLAGMVQAVVGEGQVDPILRVQLVSTLCTLTKAGSLAAEKHKPFLEFEADLTRTMEEINLLADWADPRSRDVLDRRQKCQLYLAGIATVDFGRVWPSSSQLLDEIRSELTIPYTAVGWMTHDEAGKPQIDVSLPPGGWTLLAAIPSQAGGSGGGRLQVLGRFERDTLHLVPEATSSHFVPGRLVFARPLAAPQVSAR